MIWEAADVLVCAATPHLSNAWKCLAKLTSQWRWIYVFISTAKLIIIVIQKGKFAPNQNSVTKLFCGLTSCKRVFGLLVLMFSCQYFDIYLRDNTINKTCGFINVEGQLSCQHKMLLCQSYLWTGSLIPVIICSDTPKILQSFFLINWKWPLSGKPPLRVLQHYIWLLIPVAKFPATYYKQEAGQLWQDIIENTIMYWNGKEDFRLKTTKYHIFISL